MTDEDRQHHPTKFWNAATFWYDKIYSIMYHPGESLCSYTAQRFSANMAVATLNIGSLGGSLGLGFWECFIVILVVNVTSDLLPAWTATAGLTGLRMTTFSYAVPITLCFLSLTP